jgi:hypothetical protein
MLATTITYTYTVVGAGLKLLFLGYLKKNLNFQGHRIKRSWVQRIFLDFSK